jgi:hypothetical protein
MLMLQKLIADAKDRPGKVGQVGSWTVGQLDGHSATLGAMEDHAWSGDVEGVLEGVVVVVDFWPRAQLRQAMETEATAAEAESQGDYEVRCGWNVMAGEYRNIVMRITQCVCNIMSYNVNI